MTSKIPDRWLEYKPCGNIIEGTRIICFKVPLKSCRGVHRNAKWTVNELLDEVPNLGAVIDLTNTRRYYNPNELVSAGIKHKKILMPGRIIPPEEDVRNFMNIMDEYLARDVHSLVGVHCTHGLNRTGYMVCRYMRDRLGIPAAQAIKMFEAARGYRIERKNYIARLMDKPPCKPYFGGKTSVVPVNSTTERRPY